MRSYHCDTDWILSIIVIHNYHTLIIASDDRKILVWNTSTNQSRFLGNLETEWMWTEWMWAEGVTLRNTEQKFDTPQE